VLAGEGDWESQIELTTNYKQAAYAIIRTKLKEYQQKLGRKSTKWKKLDLHNTTVDLVLMLKNDGYGHDRGVGFDELNVFAQDTIKDYFRGSWNWRYKLGKPNVTWRKPPFVHSLERDIEEALSSENLPTKYQQITTSLVFYPKDDYAVIDVANKKYIHEVDVIIDHLGKIVSVNYITGEHYEEQVGPDTTRTQLKNRLRVFKKH